MNVLQVGIGRGDCVSGIWLGFGVELAFISVAVEIDVGFSVVDKDLHRYDLPMLTYIIP